MRDSTLAFPPLSPWTVAPVGVALTLGAVAFGQLGAGGAAMVAIGLFAGLALYHASFGFTAAWRRFFLERKSAGIRAQIAMLAVASLAFFPLLGLGELGGRPLSGFVFPVGLALVLGAFVFGIGMQLGGGCGSGTLFTVGGGSLRMVVTLAFFVLGATLATAFSDVWLLWPALPPVSLIGELGAYPALAAMLTVLAALYAVFRAVERRRHGSLAPIQAPDSRWATGPWSLLAGALALAGVNVAVLLVSGWPWGITSAFALWGSKAAMALGFAPESWAYWEGQRATLAASVFADPTSLADFGIVLGAMAAALAAGKFRPTLAIPFRSVLAAMLGGLLLGIGSRLGTGCNIGAFFSGTVSGSLHGWVWLGAAIAGNAVGLRLRPWFRLD